MRHVVNLGKNVGADYFVEWFGTETVLGWLHEIARVRDGTVGSFFVLRPKIGRADPLRRFLLQVRSTRYSPTGSKSRGVQAQDVDDVVRSSLFLLFFCLSCIFLTAILASFYLAVQPKLPNPSPSKKKPSSDPYPFVLPHFSLLDSTRPINLAEPRLLPFFVSSHLISQDLTTILLPLTGTPTAVWRRTGELVAVGQEFSILTEWPLSDLLYVAKEKKDVARTGGGPAWQGKHIWEVLQQKR